ncbi:uncharacterized protein DFL_004455 [Arthrobotrys flagrans]|uniref:NACHT-NTPase and P-loop NTPases N-terminal domain-containing protein n=1 Tax=Arthrobotrys flagrans TaxID=97331 RepID=A0A437A4Z4_ARTFL|nr:hypothetical protein DFL_004455 [Arthrobotrys flagrans]
MALTASIVGFLSISGGIVDCLRARSGVEMTPNVLKDVAAQLPLITDSLEKIAVDGKNGSITTEEQHKLLPVVTGCLEQVTTLDNLVQDLLPPSEDFKSLRIRKSILRDSSRQGLFLPA